MKRFWFDFKMFFKRRWKKAKHSWNYIPIGIMIFCLFINILIVAYFININLFSNSIFSDILPYRSSVEVYIEDVEDDVYKLHVSTYESLVRSNEWNSVEFITFKNKDDLTIFVVNTDTKEIYQELININQRDAKCIIRIDEDDYNE